MLCMRVKKEDRLILEWNGSSIEVRLIKPGKSRVTIGFHQITGERIPVKRIAPQEDDVEANK